MRNITSNHIKILIMIGRNRFLTCCFYYVPNCYTTFPSNVRSYPATIPAVHHHNTRATSTTTTTHAPMKATTETTHDGDDATNHVRVQKQILRKEIRTKLKALSPQEIQQQSRAVWDRLHAMKIYQDATSIGLFLSMPTGEIDTAWAVQHAIQSGKDLYLPQVGQNFEKSDMDLIQIQTTATSSSSMPQPTPSPQDPSAVTTDVPLYHHWPKNKWNIPEPPPYVILKTAQPGDLDVLILPGLAFDARGNRLGQGKGYYDRFLARMCGETTNRSSTTPILVAVALSCQFMENDDDDDDVTKDGDTTSSPRRTIPVHEHDFPVDWIILPNQSIEITK